MNLNLNNICLDVKRDCNVISIPDGKNFVLHSGEKIYIMQSLGGMFVVEIENGQYARIDGKDADAIGKKIPKECKSISFENMNKKSVKEIAWDQLKTCYDPEVPINIVELGIIYNINIPNYKKDLIEVKMTLTAPGCGMGEVLKNDIEQKLKYIPGIKKVEIEIVFDPIWTPKMMSEAARLHLGLM